MYDYVIIGRRKFPPRIKVLRVVCIYVINRTLAACGIDFCSLHFKATIEKLRPCLKISTFSSHFPPSLKEFLPKEYIKQRGAEKKIFQVWSPCSR